MEKTDIQELIVKLSDKNGNERRHARAELAKLGDETVDPLIVLLDSADHKLRWEAVKTLGQVHSTKALPALIKSLTDDKSDVRWLAAEGLIHLGKESLEHLMHELVKNYKSLHLRSGAHHILKSLKQKGHFEDTHDLIRKLGKHFNIGDIAVSAEKLLEDLKKKTGN